MVVLTEIFSFMILVNERSTFKNEYLKSILFVATHYCLLYDIVMIVSLCVESKLLS